MKQIGTTDRVSLGVDELWSVGGIVNVLCKQTIRESLRTK